MATVTQPTAAEVATLTGIRPSQQLSSTSGDILTDEEFTTLVDALVDASEPVVAISVGAGLYDGGGLTSRQAQMLANAIAYRAAAAFVSGSGTQRATGTYPPYVAETSDEIASKAAYFTNEAKTLENLVVTGTATPAFAKPVCSSSTFGHSATDRSPVSRNDLLDESDNIGAWNEAEG